jgi:ABC-type uncharacterized transport system permease subunit
MDLEEDTVDLLAIVAVICFMIGHVWLFAMVWGQNRMIGFASFFIPLISLMYGIQNADEAKVPLRLMGLGILIGLFNIGLKYLVENQPM